jgi:hypothetical protein
MHLQFLLLQCSISLLTCTHIRQAQNKIFSIYRLAPSGHFDLHSALLIATRKNTSNLCINITLSYGRVTIVAMEKQRSITYSGCVFVIFSNKSTNQMQQSLLLDVYSYVQLNMFREFSRPSSGAQLQ